MLKRYQILLNEWQAEHYRSISVKYDVSFSEMIRMALCYDTIKATELMFPKYRSSIDEKKLRNVIKGNDIIEEMGMDGFHEFLSRIYFEARKASEFWAKHFEEKK
ncbi:MAG: hypothetical protein ABIJ27_00540 [Candidatus Omnitrophota bacterium]